MAIKLDKSMLAKNLVLNHYLVQHIDRAIGEGEMTWEAKFEPKVGDDAWHPSGDCIPSPNVLYHKAVDALEGTVGKGFPVSLLKTFTVGHFFHHYVQHLVVERLGFASWDDVERQGQTRWGKEPFQWATGAGDIAPCRIPAHGDFLVDIKTMGSHDYRQPRLPNWCAAKYECQVNIYMDWFNLDKTIILAVQKDSPHAFKEWHFTKNQPLIDAIYSKWRLVGDCIEQGVEPDEDFDIPLPILGPV